MLLIACVKIDHLHDLVKCQQECIKTIDLLHNFKCKKKKTKNNILCDITLHKKIQFMELYIIDRWITLINNIYLIKKVVCLLFVMLKFPKPYDPHCVKLKPSKISQ